MKLAPLALAACFTAAAYGADCPAPVVKIAGPCPKEVICKNLPAAAPCPACVCNPAPCPPGRPQEAPQPCPACPEATPPAMTPTAPPTAPHGVWSIPLTVGWLPSSETSISWNQSLRQKRGTESVELASAGRLFYGAGLAWQATSGYQVALQGLWIPSGSLRSSRHGSHALDEAFEIRSGQPEARASGGHWGAAITVSIPLRRRP